MKLMMKNACYVKNLNQVSIYNHLLNNTFLHLLLMLLFSFFLC